MIRNSRRSIEQENTLLRCGIIGCGLLASYTLGVLFEPSMLESDQREANLYAEMVCLGRESIAETGTMQVGWPNYKGLTVDCDPR
jgi:hypothetical protein